MKETLKETYFCDYNHPAIRKLAHELAEQTSDPMDIAQKTFYYVRDNIITGYDLYKMKASDILKKGYGICWGKSTLLIALLRCNKIEAQFGTVPVHRKISWGIDWNGEDDCSLYSESILGSPEIHADIDGTIRNKAGNSEHLEFIAKKVNHFLNQRIWKKTGVRYV